ncbi:MAG: hypothetical protein INR73_00925 [Williamsia sp.]|nr:hypothetical protein [Williamsia sp.]
MKHKLIPVFLFLLTACSQDLTVEVKRNPLIQFNYGTASWKANQYYFTDVAKVVAYPAGQAQTGKIYNRLTLQAFGETSKNENLQLTLAFDVEDPAQLVGTYRNSYTVQRGLASAQIFNLNSNSLAAYELVKTDTTAFLQIQRQGQSERLIAGVFRMTVQNIKDTSQKITLANGVLTDINY